MYTCYCCCCSCCCSGIGEYSKSLDPVYYFDVACKPVVVAVVEEGIECLISLEPVLYFDVASIPVVVVVVVVVVEG